MNWTIFAGPFPQPNGEWHYVAGCSGCGTKTRFRVKSEVALSVAQSLLTDQGHEGCPGTLSETEAAD